MTARLQSLAVDGFTLWYLRRRGFLIKAPDYSHYAHPRRIGRKTANKSATYGRNRASAQEYLAIPEDRRSGRTEFARSKGLEVQGFIDAFYYMRRKLRKGVK